MRLSYIIGVSTSSSAVSVVPVLPAEVINCNEPHARIGEPFKCRLEKNDLTVDQEDVQYMLTVREEAGFPRMGGMIAFASQDGKVRSYVKVSAAEPAVVTARPRLMILATNPPADGERRR
jgi:hypothetical protein